MVGIIDYGCGNVQSILNMHTKIGVWAETVSNPSNLNDFDSIILPGVGTFDRGVKELKASGFWDPLKELIHSQSKPILGICLGMQLLFEKSEEGTEDGFGVFQSRIIRFKEDKVARIPHMGWKPLEINEHLSWLPNSGEEYYFVHAFHASNELNEQEISAKCSSPICFPAIVQKGKIVGIQFHPEKSLKAGMALFEAYYKLLSKT